MISYKCEENLLGTSSICINVMHILFKCSDNTILPLGANICSLSCLSLFPVNCVWCVMLCIVKPQKQI